MNTELLIESIVRQTTVLIAQLATASGRTPLANVANQIFLDLIRELKEQGLGNKVIADMFGLTLRTYHHRIRRLAESSTFRGRSLWEETLAFIQERGTVRRTDVLSRFCNDDERVLTAILSDLTDEGIVFRSGRADRATYRAATAEEVGVLDDEQRRRALECLLVVTISRFGPLSREEVASHLHTASGTLDEALKELVANGKINAENRAHGGTQYTCEHCFIPFDEPAGWEAAVFDHYQALVTAVGVKLRRGKRSGALDDSTGGSTYTFDLWEGHPMQKEVLSLLRKLRQEGRSLRERVEAFNSAQGVARQPGSPELRVITYVGQAVLESEQERSDGEW